MSYKQVDKLSVQYDKQLLNLSGKSARSFAVLVGKARVLTNKRMRELTQSLELAANPTSIQNDIYRSRRILEELDTIWKKNLVTGGVIWAENVFPRVHKLGLKEYNAFESVVGLPLSSFGKVDELQIGTALNSWKTMMGGYTEQVKQRFSDELTVHIMSGVGDRTVLAERLQDIAPTELAGGRVKSFINAELTKINREGQTVRQAEYDDFRFTGPDDERISDICKEHLGVIMSRDEWLELDPEVFSYGLHYNCRHRLYPIKEEWLTTPEELQGWEDGRIEYD